MNDDYLLQNRAFGGKIAAESPRFTADLLKPKTEQGREEIAVPTVTHTVTPQEAGRTVKSLALKEMALSRGRLSSLKFSGGLKLDGAPVRTDVYPAAGQVITARWEETGGAALAPCPADFSIVYEDEYYYVLDKPAPLPTLASPHQTGGALENGLYAYLGCPAGFVFRPVNRLDKGTSGLMAAAKDGHAQQRLQRLLHTDAFIREYLALCLGAPPDGQGVIDLPIGRESGVKRAVRPDGQRAVTHYRVEQTRGALSLLRLRLDTGRTHQIRVHLSALGCPILGDYLYGQPDPRLPGRFALHACRLAFRHPFTGDPVEVESPLPEELMNLFE